MFVGSGGSPAASAGSGCRRRGHSVLAIAWHLPTNESDHEDLGGDYFSRRDRDSQSQRLVSQLRALGSTVDHRAATRAA
jgi:hypothetical protein